MRAALGFRLHTGWAAAVALGGTAPNLRLLLRERIELLPDDESIPRFVYHAAAERSLDEARELVESAKMAARQSATRALAHALKAIAVPIETACLTAGSMTVSPKLESILASHPMIHAAEGALFGQALTAACEALDIHVISVREREVWPKAALSASMEEHKLRTLIDGLRKDFGPPWSADQKIAAAAAILAGSAKK